MVKCPRGCGVFLEFGTDTLGRTVECCPRCGATGLTASAKIDEHTPPAIAVPRPAPAPPPPPTDSMPKKYPKTCQRSGKTFLSNGPAGRFCGTCDECKAAENGTTKPARAPKPEKPETKRAPANTGYQPSTPGAPSSRITSEIASMKEELEQLDARRAELRAEIRTALEELQELANA